MMRAIYDEPRLLVEKVSDLKNRHRLLDQYGFSPKDINWMFLENPGTDFYSKKYYGYFEDFVALVRMKFEFRNESKALKLASSNKSFKNRTKLSCPQPIYRVIPMPTSPSVI